MDGIVRPNHSAAHAAAPRVLFLRNSRGITDITGAETYILTAMRGLSQSGCVVHLLCADIAAKGETAWHRALRDNAIPHLIVDVPRTLSTADFRAAAAMCARFRPDVIHATDHRADAVAVWTARKSGVPAVASFFGWTNWKSSSLRGRLYPVFDRLVMRRLRRIIVDSAHVGGHVRSAAPQTQVTVIPNGVDLSRFDADRVVPLFKRQWFGRDDVWLVGMIGRLHPNKGHRDTVDVAARLLRDHPQMRFVILGDPPRGYEAYAQGLRAAVVAAGLVERFLVTNVASAQIPGAIASFDVTLIASHMESLSYVLLESMAMRKPVISTRVGGHGDLIRHGENGFLVDPGDGAAMQDLLTMLAADPDLARRVGAAGHDTVRSGYSTEAMIARTRAVYQEVMP